MKVCSTHEYAMYERCFMSVVSMKPGKTKELEISNNFLHHSEKEHSWLHRMTGKLVYGVQLGLTFTGCISQHYTSRPTWHSWSQSLTELPWRGYSQAATVETGRWEPPRPPRHERLCNICRKLDDEFHFVLECKALQPLRRQLLPQNTWQRPSMAKFIALLSSTDETTINKLAEFVRKGFRLRQFGFKYPEHLSILSFIPNPSFG